jgi:hypothetical protein
MYDLLLITALCGSALMTVREPERPMTWWYLRGITAIFMLVAYVCASVR